MLNNTDPHDASDRAGSADEPYNPYQEYLKQRIHDSANENEYNFKPRTLSEKPVLIPPTRLVSFAFWASIFALIAFAFSNIYVALIAALLGLAASITSRFLGNEEGRFHRRALIALVISLIVIALIAFMFIFILYIYPELLKDPSYQEMLREITEQLQQQMPEYFPKETLPAVPDDIL